ncbi:MAG TPA: KpsF/GutQ family sugar-phosphate isomerase [Deltaproteobacteria bacterium]|nr:KpsF/GutQ family sugar-phosphate isomerase [Deltaproteobacteria bacterium]
MTDQEIISIGREAIRIEIEGLESLLDQLDEAFVRAVETISSLKGKVVLTGIGKSGIIAKKIASTMMSIGTPAIFMHPVDGLHGDLGAIMPQDACLIISNSGRTKEICDLLTSLKSLAIQVIAITGDPESPLARQADITLTCTVRREACNMGLAPTASTTAQLALGDAIAVVLSRIKGFNQEAFKILHPAGELGKQLSSKISQLMITGNNIPMVTPDTPLEKIVREMTDKSLGLTLVGEAAQIQGIITDGDLRRGLLNHGSSLEGLTASDIMSSSPRRISGDKLALDALDMMAKFQITSLIVTDELGVFSGVIHLHDLLGRGKLGLRGT